MDGRLGTFRWMVLLLIVLSALPMAVWAHNLRPFGPETAVSDVWYRTRPRLAPRSDMVIVARDRETIRRIGKPDHADYARLIRRLREAGAEWIVLDLDLDDRQGRAADGALWRAIQASHRTLILIRYDETRTGVPDDDELRGLRALERSAHWQEFGLNNRTPEWGWLNFAPATSDFIHSAHGAGVAVTEESLDPDGVLRRSRTGYLAKVLYPSEKEQGKLTNYYAVVPNLAVITAVSAMGGDKTNLAYRFGDQLRLGTTTQPLDARGYTPVDYAGPSGTFPRVSMADVLEKKPAPNAFKDKIVFIGSTVPGDELSEYRMTPFGRSMPRVEITANQVQSMLNRRPVVLPHVAGAWAVLVLGLLLGAVAPFFRPAGSVLMSLAMLAVYFLVGWVLFWTNAVMLPIIPALVLTLAAVAITLGLSAAMRPYAVAEYVEVRDTGMAMGPDDALPGERPRRWNPFRGRRREL